LQIQQPAIRKTTNQINKLQVVQGRLLMLRQLALFKLVKIKRLQFSTLLTLDERGPDSIDFGHSFLFAPNEVTD